MYRIKRGQLEVFLVHHGGPFFRKKDLGAWFVPKGTLETDELPLEAAVREFTEETGIVPQGEFVPLGSVRYKSGKRVHAWAFRGDIEEPFAIKTLMVELEWPPRSGKMIHFPEIDRAEFFGVAEAKRKAHPAHGAFIERLDRYLKKREPTRPETRQRERSGPN